MIKSRSIAVIGAGIAGLAVATALARYGARVSVFEQAPEITEVGAGLQISPNGFAVLKALGLERQLRQCAVEAQAVVLRDYKRAGEVLRLDLATYASDLTFAMVHRADLIGVLEQAARAAGVTLHLNATVEMIEDGVSPALVLSDGRRVEAELIVSAEGLHARARHLLNGKERPFFTGQVAWRATVPAREKALPEAQVFTAPHRHLVTYPLRDGQLHNIVAVQERAAWTEEGWSHRDDPDRLRKVFADFGPEPSALLGSVTEVHLWGLFRYPVAQTWHGHRVALLGDAAHPTLPFLAQGANLALEDAWVLAAMLSRDSMSDALPRYQASRRARAQRVISAANRNAWKYHVAFPPARWLGHRALSFAGRRAPARMVRQFDWLYRHDVTKEYPGSDPN